MEVVLEQASICKSTLAVAPAVVYSQTSTHQAKHHANKAVIYTVVL